MEKVKNNNEKKYGEKMQNKVRRGEERKGHLREKQANKSKPKLKFRI